MNTRQAILACGHETVRRVPVGWVPPPNSVFPCLFHGFQSIKVIHDREWRMRCFYTALDGTVCRYGRWCGQSRATARRLAKDHTNRLMSRDHPVAVAYDTITRDGRGVILRSGSRLPSGASVESFGLTRTQNGTQLDLSLYLIDATVNTTPVDTLPAPF